MINEKANIVLMKINAALNVLRVVEGTAGTLPRKYERVMPQSSVTEAIRGLEIAKAELMGEAWPVRPELPKPAGFDPSDFVDN